MNKNTIGFGDSEFLLKEVENDSIHLIFTSPPYFNARPEYSIYDNYEDYLEKMRRIIRECCRVLKEGRFFAINSSPVLVPRKDRNHSSKRLPIPFDLHRVVMEEGFDFIDDIIWVKPDGSAKGRGRNFYQKRLPLTYKANPITEYIFVYRKRTDNLIDWNIKNDVTEENKNRSFIKDDYEKTNVWKINPSSDKIHPAVFPIDLAKNIISYYSFVNDVVMDPFAGVGTVGQACSLLNRKYVLFEKNKDYIKELIDRLNKNIFEDSINFINC